MMAWLERLFGRAEAALSPATPRDAASLSGLHAASFNRGWSEHEFEQLLTDRGVVAERATSGRRNVGFIVSRRAADEAEILSVAVARSWRGRGLARRLLDLHLRRLAGLGLRAVFLEVDEDNTRRPALRAGGFREVGRRPDTMRNPAARARWCCAGTLYNTGRRPRDCRERVQAKFHRSAVRCQGHAHDRAAPRDRARAGGFGRPPDVEELYRRCAKIDEHISISTVYRTVKLFEDSGIITRHDFREGRARYEQIPEAHHDHLINLRNGQVIEFQSEEIERLQREVARKLGYKLVDHRLELYAVPLDDDKKR